MGRYCGVVVVSMKGRGYGVWGGRREYEGEALWAVIVRWWWWV